MPARRANLFRLNTGTSLSGGVDGIKLFRNGALEWFKLGGQRFTRVQAEFYTDQDGAFADPDLDGNVGLIFDYGGSRIAFVRRS